jgi:hypothetical protein
VDDATLKPAEQVDPLLAIGHARILLRDNRMVEHRLAAVEIEPVGEEIGFSLPLISGRHSAKCSYKKLSMSRRGEVEVARPRS